MYLAGRADRMKEETDTKKKWKEEVRVQIMRQIKREMKYQFSLGTTEGFKKGSGLRLAFTLLRELEIELQDN